MARIKERINDGVRPRVDHYRRDGDGWTLTITEGVEKSLALESLGCTLRLAELFARVLPEPGT